MNKIRRHLGPLCCAVGAIFTLLATWVIAGSICYSLPPLLDTSVARAGLPYALGIGCCGVAIAGALLYTAVLLTRQWNTAKFLLAFRTVILVCMFASVASTVWFMVAAKFFHISGLIGLVAALSVGQALLEVIRRIREHGVSAVAE